MRKRYQFKKLISTIVALALVVGCLATANTQRAKADTEDPQILDELWINVDGKPDEWGLISNMADAPATFNYIKSVKTKDYLYIAAKTADEPASAPEWFFGINTDGDAATGYSDHGGADYSILGDGHLYKNLVPDDWSFENADETGYAFATSEDGSFVEVKFNLNVIGDNSKLNFSMLDGGWTYVFKNSSIVPDYKAAINSIGEWDGKAFTNNGSDGAYVNGNVDKGEGILKQEVVDSGLKVVFEKHHNNGQTRFWINLEGDGADLSKAEKMVISYTSDKAINFDNGSFVFHDKIEKEGRKELATVKGASKVCDGLIIVDIPSGTSGVAKSIRFKSDKFEESIPAGTTVLFRSIDFIGAEDSGSATIVPEGENFNIDGNSSDWKSIESVLDETDGAFDRIAACFDDDYIYLLFVTNTTKWMGHHIWINADCDASTGYQVGGIGYDYLIENSSIYPCPTNNWPDSTDGTATVVKSKDGTTVEFKIPRNKVPFEGDKTQLRLELYNDSWATVYMYPGSGTFDVKHIDEVKIVSDQPFIEKFELSTPELYSLTEETTKNGVVGSFSAEGGDGEKYSYSFAFNKQNGPDNSKFRIEGDKLICNTKMLAPGEYRIYVKVKSGVRFEFKAFSIIVKASTGKRITEDIFNGQKGEWFAVDYSTANPIPNLTELRAVADSENLWIYAGANNMGLGSKFYISDGITAGKNMKATWTDADSLAFMVDAQGIIYKYSGTSFEDTGKKAEIGIDVTGFEAKIPLSVFAEGATKFGVAVDDGAGAILPNAENALLSVTKPLEGNGPKITLDADRSDWSDEYKVGVGTGYVGDLWAARTADYLYVFTSVDVPDNEIETEYSYSTNLFIDSDGNPMTGYRLIEMYGEKSVVGADFLLQDWYITNQEFSYKTVANGNLNGFFSHSAGGCGENLDWKVTKRREGTNIFDMEFAIPIAKMEEVSSLAIDDINVSVSRDQQVRTATTGFTKADRTDGVYLSSVPKYGTKFDISIDGKFTDWSKIPNVVINTADENVYNLYATKSQYKLYAMLVSENNDLDTLTRFVINTNDSTGYSYFGIDKADYVVMNGNLYPVKGKDRIGKKIKAADVTYDFDAIELRLYLEDIKNPDTIKIAVLAKDKTVKVPSNRYMTVAADVDMFYADGYVYPYENFEVYNNPYKGWTGWANFDDDEDIAYDYNMMYFPVTWDDIEAKKGVFNWDNVDKVYRLKYWKEKGVRVNFRFVMDTPEPLSGSLKGTTYGYTVNEDFIKGKNTEKLNLVENGRVTEKKIKQLFDTHNYRADIPAWLVADLCNEVLDGKAEDAGTFYNWPSADVLGGAGFSPNYYSEALIDRHDKMIEAFAKKFDNGATTGFVQVGSLGHWGEFHTWPEEASFGTGFGSGVFPDPKTAGRYAQAYIDHFKYVKIGIRYPYPFAAKNGLGLFNDMFGDPEGTQMFLGAIENGNTDNMKNPGPTDVADSKMPDFWKTNYSGGEFSHGDVLRHVDDDSIMTTIGFVKDSHTSWVGPCSPCDLKDGEFDAYKYEANIHYLQRTMGYRFSVKSASYTPSIARGEKFKVDINWRNTGVAPFYYNWPVEVSLLDNKGNVVAKTVTKDDIRTWMPDSDINMSATLYVPNTVKDGKYTVAVAILDPDTKKPAVHLAMEGGNKDLRYGLYYTTVGISEFTKKTADDALQALTGDANGVLFNANVENTSTVTIKQSTIKPGKAVYVYFYDRRVNQLAEITGVNASVAEDGTITFAADKSGTYILLDKKAD